MLTALRWTGPLRKDWIRQTVDVIQSLAAGDAATSLILERIAALTPPETRLERYVLLGLLHELSEQKGDAHRLWLLTTYVQAFHCANTTRRSASDDGLAELARAAKEVMDRDFARSLNVMTIGRTLRVHRNVLGRAFKDAYGQTLRQYLTEVRIKHAFRLLLTTDDKVETIANAVGFKDRATFSICYHKTTGSTPSATRLLTRANLNAKPAFHDANSVVTVEPS